MLSQINCAMRSPCLTEKEKQGFQKRQKKKKIYIYLEFLTKKESMFNLPPPPLQINHSVSLKSKYLVIQCLF